MAASIETGAEGYGVRPRQSSNYGAVCQKGYTRIEQERDVIDALYRAFADYARPDRATACAHCWSADELAAVRTTPLRELDGELARRLPWETDDHWHDVLTYKHYLPRLLELLVTVEDLYPGHVLETMRAFGFPVWPAAERDAVRTYLDTLDETRKALPGLNDERSRIAGRHARAALEPRHAFRG